MQILLIIWIIGALATPLVIFLSEILAALARGPEYQAWAMKKAKEWQRAPHKSEIWVIPRVFLTWPALLYFWFSCLWKNQTPIEALAQAENEEIQKDMARLRMVNVARAKLVDYLNSNLWFIELDHNTQEIRFYQVISQGEILIVTHVVSDNLRGDYIIHRINAKYPCADLELPLERDLTATSFHEAVNFCISDNPWLDQCRQGSRNFQQ